MELVNREKLSFFSRTRTCNTGLLRMVIRSRVTANRWVFVAVRKNLDRVKRMRGGDVYY